jgi:MoxR-like ATPase
MSATELKFRAENRFELRKGPIFANVILADEINRASPKTQSALLEAMQEYQIGDPRNWINWRLSARHPRKLLTNEFETE